MRTKITDRRTLSVIACIVFACTTALVADAASKQTTARAGTLAANPNGTIRIGFLATAPSLDPATATGSHTTPQIFPLYDRLTALSADGSKALPMLATSWAFAPGGRTLTFHLRHDAVFHDGSAVTAAAVKANIVRGQTLKGSTIGVYLQGIKTIDVVDKFTVRLNLNGTGAELPNILATDAGDIVNPKFFSADLAHNPPAGAGSGPYVLKSATFPTDFKYTRAPGPNWDKNAGRAKNLEILFTNTSANGINAVRSGQLDLALVTADGAANAKQLVKQGAFNGTYVVTNAVLQLVMNITRAPYSNLLVRRAVASAINRNAIGNQLFGGNCNPTNQVVPTTDWSFDKTFKDPNPYDPAKAKTLLAQAGFPNGFSTNLLYLNTSIFPSVTQVIQAELAAAGIKATLDGPEIGSGVTRTFTRDYDLTSFVAIGGADPSAIFNWNYAQLGITGGASQASLVKGLGEKALSPRLARSARAALYHQVWDLSTTQAWSVPICAQGEEWVYSKKMLNVPGAPWMFVGNIDPRYLAISK